MLATIEGAGETACSPPVDRRIWTVSDSVNIILQFYFKRLAKPLNSVPFAARTAQFKHQPGQPTNPEASECTGESAESRR